MEDKKLKELAQTLKKSGLAVSDYEAVEKAKAILGTKIQNQEEQKEPIKEPINAELSGIKEKSSEEKAEHKKEGFFSHFKEKLHHEKKPDPERHRFSEPEYDVSREELTVNDLMREVDVNPEVIPEEKNRTEDVTEKISELKEEILEVGKNPEEGKMEDIKNKMEEIKEEMQDIEKEKIESQEEKKIDLSKIFDFNKK